ncbi:unnamed protein product [Rhizopus stolonifer]
MLKSDESAGYFQLDETISTDTNKNNNEVDEAEICTANNGQYSTVNAVSAEDEHITSDFKDEIDGGETDNEHQDFGYIDLESPTCPVSEFELRAINLLNLIKLFAVLFIHTSYDISLVKKGTVILLAFLNLLFKDLSLDIELPKTHDTLASKFGYTMPADIIKEYVACIE